jgi:hypothetical protein
MNSIMSIIDESNTFEPKENVQATLKWQRLLKKEIAHSKSLAQLSRDEVFKRVKKQGILSANSDTVASLDFPHYCIGATEGCGGAKGWCYTFQGFQSLSAHSSKVGLVDYCIRTYPEMVVNLIVKEIQALVNKGQLPYPNLRFSGSGEVAAIHIGLLTEIKRRGIQLWGFSRNIKVATELKSAGIHVIFSCDQTTPTHLVDQAIGLQVPLAYTSCNVKDLPSYEVAVVFPLHRGGRVRQVADHMMNCPKVIEEYFDHSRTQASCQNVCRRCHE